MKKLVRDNIPSMCAEGTYTFETAADDVVYEEYLYKKLQEEVNEFLEDKNLEELADILEVLNACARHLGFTYSDIVDAACKKRNERGSFINKIIMTSES